MELDRRAFLRSVGAAGVGGVSLPVLADRIAATNPVEGPDSRFGVLMDIPNCIGCRKCEYACEEAAGFGPPPIETYDDKSVFALHRRPDPKRYTTVNEFPNPADPGKPVYVKVQCMHCNEPGCASACLTNAFRKTPEGAVIYDERVCIGCRYCMVACPFDIPAYTYDDPYSPVIRKCTMCFERVTRQGDIPACVKICPQEALTFGRRGDLIELGREKITHNPGKYVQHIYGEHEVGGTSWMYISSRPFEELDFRTDLGTTPYPELTKGFLSAVPLVLILWPALLMGSYAFTGRRQQLGLSNPANPHGGLLELGESVERRPASAQPKPQGELPHAELPEASGTDRAAQEPPRRHTDWRAWVTDKLFMGLSPGQYAKALVTPFNVIAALILCVGLPVTWIRFTRGLAATTHLSDDYPWGLWIGFDVLCGVGLAGGGYVLASTVYLFGLKDYRPLLRPAILTGFLGYFFVVVGLCYDLGRPWRLPYPMLVSYGVTSVMFLVGWNVALYLTVQLLEFCPAIFEWLDLKTLRRWAEKLTIGATVFGVILSTLHQSALGALFLLAPGKVHPLWYSPFIPVFFFISSIIAGLAMVVVESALSHRIFRTQVADHGPGEIDRLVVGLGRAASVLLFTYFCLKWLGVAHGQHWALLNTPYGYLFLLEVFGFVLAPCLLYAHAARRQNAGLVRFTSVLTVLGILLNRLNVSLIAYQWDHQTRYFPHWMEFMVTITIVTVGLLTFRWIANRMPVLYDHPRYAAAH